MIKIQNHTQRLNETPVLNSVSRVAVIGTGPAALMVADIVSKAGHSVSVFEKKKGPGRKLLIAGSSGLNVTNSLPIQKFIETYPALHDFWRKVLNQFSPQDWLQWIHSLQIETFEGTSGRYFTREMKASRLLRSWLTRLQLQAVQFFYNHEVTDFSVNASHQISVQFERTDKDLKSFDAVCFCMGGASYEPKETPLRWPSIFIRKGLRFHSFVASNVGYQVKWNDLFLKEAEGLPLKNIQLSSSRGQRRGEMVITRYGLEGTPVYFVGESGVVKLDLKPDLTLQQILKKCQATQENLSPLRRIKKNLSLSPAALALIYHHAPKEALTHLPALAELIKNFPIVFQESQGLDEAISSAGGLDLTELNDQMMLKDYPGVFAAGEMLNWDAPTGGFLIQGCVSQGHCAGNGILNYLTRMT